MARAGASGGAIMSDAERGRQHGRLGLEARYPHNVLYMEAFRDGEAWLLREVNKDRPYGNMTPGGTNDSHFDAWES